MATPTKTPERNTALTRNAISTFGIVVLVLSVASPLIGLTGAVPSAMVLGNGLGVPLAYVAVGAILLLLSIGFVAMSRQVTNAGALYAYVGRGLGIPMGLGAAGLALWAYTMIQIAAYGFFGVVLTGTINSWWGVEMPWYVATIGLIALVQIFGYLKIEVGTKVLLVVMVLEWTVMLVMAFAILIRGGAGEGFAVSEVWSPIGLVSGAAIIGLVFAFASMFGFEASAIYGEEARNPKKAVARATVISIAMITAFFAFTGWMLIVGYGPSNAIDAAAASLQSGDPAQYVFNAGATYLGPWAPDIMSIFVITSLFACTLAFHNGIARYQYTLARDGIFPKILSRTNVHGTPYMSSFLQTGTALALIILAVITNSDPILVVFFWGSGIAVVSIVTVYILTAVAIIVYFRRNPDVDRRAWNTTIAPVLSLLILIVVLYNIVANLDVLVATPKGEALLLASTTIVAFLLGVGLYALRRRSLSPEALADLAEEVM